MFEFRRFPVATVEPTIHYIPLFLQIVFLTIFMLLFVTISLEIRHMPLTSYAMRASHAVLPSSIELPLHTVHHAAVRTEG